MTPDPAGHRLILMYLVFLIFFFQNFHLHLQKNILFHQQLSHHNHLVLVPGHLP